MNNRFVQPYFVFRPRTFLSSLAKKFQKRPDEAWVTLPWGDTLRVNPQEAGGHRLYMHGIHDLVVTEVIFRVVVAGDTVLDVGANLGAITSAMSHCVGSTGKVFSFEAHPRVFARLELNVKSMRNHRAVTLINKAVSVANGSLKFVEASEFEINQGTSHVLRPDEQEYAAIYDVPCCALDDVIQDEHIKLCKIDVERHEEEVLKGAQRLLKKGQIETFVFEDWDRQTNLQNYLRDFGYVVFKLDYDLFGLRLTDLHGIRPSESSTDIADFFATKSERVVERLRQRGWLSLKS